MDSGTTLKAELPDVDFPTLRSLTEDERYLIYGRSEQKKIQLINLTMNLVTLFEIILIQLINLIKQMYAALTHYAFHNETEMAMPSFCLFRKDSNEEN